MSAERKNTPITRRELLTAGAFGLTGLFVAGGIAAWQRGAPVVTPNQEAAASGSNPEPSPALAAAASTPEPTIAHTSTVAPPTETPELAEKSLLPETVVPTTATTAATETVAPKPSPTEEVIITPTVTPAAPTIAATPTETLRDVEQSPLPEYGVFMGDLLNEDNSKTGAITIIQVAEKPQLVIYWAKEKDKRGVVADDVCSVDLQEIQGNDFKAVNPAVAKKVRAGTYTVLGKFDDSNNRLSGTITEIGMGGGIVQELRFKANLVGSGKDKAIEAMKKTKLSSGKYGNASLQDVNIDTILRDLKNLNVELP